MQLNQHWVLVPSGALRFYDSNQFQSKTAPLAGLSLVSEKLTVFANVSRGINYPGLETTVLSNLIKPLVKSWEQLSAEELDRGEIGVKFSPTSATQIDASIFNDKVKNRHVFDFPPAVPHRNSSTSGRIGSGEQSWRSARRLVPTGRCSEE